MRKHLIFSLVPCILLMTVSAFADVTPDPQPSASPAPTEWQANYRSAGNRPGAQSGSFGTMLREGPMGGIWQRSNLLGNMFGLRSFLGQYGISLNIQETSEVLGNVSGGVKTGAYYDGLTTMDLQMDTQRAFGLRGGLFNVSALEVHGLSLSARNLLTLQTASGIEADPGIRLWELWYQQSFFYNQADIKVGAQSLDQEFIVTQYGGLFVNTMFGWPMLTSADLLSGGPAYPLASLGARARVQPAGGPWTFLGGVFDDNPSGIAPGASDDPQVLDNHGTNFRLKDKPLVIAEVQYARPALGELEYTDRAPILPGVYKLGAWYDFGQFADQFDGTPVQGNYSIYGVIDQLLWRESPESEEGVGVFLRAMGAPGEQNPVDFSLNAGVTWREPFEHRENDVLGLGLGRARISNRLSDLDVANAQVANNPNAPIRSSETFVELTYQYQVVPWWQLQPDFQYVFNPGGGIPNPNDPSGTERIANEFVIGIRTNIVL
jgi:porin